MRKSAAEKRGVQEIKNNWEKVAVSSVLLVKTVANSESNTKMRGVSKMNKVINGRNQIKRLFELRARIKKLEEIEEGMTRDALTHLKTYGTLKQDNWAAMVNAVETRRPKWKEEFVNECGKAKAETVLANTKPSVCEKVEIYKDGIKVNA